MIFIKWLAAIITSIIVGFSFAIGLAYFNLFLLTVQEQNNTKENIANSQAYINFADKKSVTTVYRGKSFFIHYILNHDELCDVDYTTTMFNSKTKSITLLRTTKTWYNKGSTELNELFDVLIDVPTGTYRFIKKAINHCNGITSYSIVFDIDGINVTDLYTLQTQNTPIRKPQTYNTVTILPNPVIKPTTELSIWPWRWNWVRGIN